ncbi:MULTISPECIES: DUF423 domain-containing protein [unclassified Leptolyngbya]|uniref:DUF423 domain-containing protein n=1 Tax=unclassified Leptolyngbya TaxID=2650499 RepID=UPI001682BEC2|nr:MULTISPECIES: DUF423 domain-containing protein [unclassified Leptolyngbya]MBD1913571.1 DUF423 domain-containing protein [Leptolyngbya sp. FACHB-8]MBD2155858.1 DUF423 domain-containing protein [Leptolyngbya sp. FACHB-16]
MTESRIFLMMGAILGGLAVASGAFASHALSEKLTERAIEIFETAARYQMYHALALLAVGLWLSRVDEGRSLLVTAGVAYLIGILLFSGSLYALSLSGIKGLGAVTPLGGVAFLVGWGCLAIAALSFK